jgi:hypothetical protein
MNKDELRDACFAYENRNGIEGFMEAMADIVRDLMAHNGLVLEFDEAGGGFEAASRDSNFPDFRVKTASTSS